MNVTEVLAMLQKPVVVPEVLKKYGVTSCGMTFMGPYE